MESLLRHYLVSRWRRLIVIILTFGLGLVVILPAADEYRGLLQRRSRLSEELERMRDVIGQMSQVQREAKAKRQLLAQWEGRVVTPESLHLFREKVVETARSAGCQIRRVNVGEVTRRPWRPSDGKPGAAPTAGAHVLRVQPMAVSLLGRLPSVKEFLGKLTEMETLIQVEQFSIQPVNPSGQEVTLELNMLLYDLIEGEKPAAG